MDLLLDINEVLSDGTGAEYYQKLPSGIWLWSIFNYTRINNFFVKNDFK